MSNLAFDAETLEMLGSPFTDGIDHINIFSLSRSELGVLLSNFTKTPFVHPNFGPFNSMEGFYYYISTGAADEKLRHLTHGQAKICGKKYPRVETKNFNDIMMEGLRCKVEQNPYIKRKLHMSSLPFKHYYCYLPKDATLENHKPYKVHVPRGAKWWCDAYEKIRSELKQDERARSVHAGSN